MQINSPAPAPITSLTDIHGRSIAVGKGRKLLLSLFRQAACPFCNYRIYDLSNNHPDLTRLDMDIVAVFHSSDAEVRRFIASRPRPFFIVADPQSTLHRAFSAGQAGIWGQLKALVWRPWALIKGLRIVGIRSSGDPDSKLMPADTLIDEHGVVIEAYYGGDIGDHMPMSRIKEFAATVSPAPPRAH